jgi:adenylate kinase family enzyme
VKELSQKVRIHLNDNIPNKIHIIGSVGSGKTTLARNLSLRYGIPHYELDNVVWKRHKSEDIRRTDEERDEYLDNIIRSNRWIIEGAHSHDWILKSFQNAELIIFLDTPYALRIIRIIRRFILQKLGVEKSNYTPTIHIFMKMFEWNAGFEKSSKPLILKMFRQSNMKSLILKDNRKIGQYFK